MSYQYSVFMILYIGVRGEDIKGEHNLRLCPAEYFIKALLRTIRYFHRRCMKKVCVRRYEKVEKYDLPEEENKCSDTVIKFNVI